MATAEQLREALKTIYDPELPINIVDLGLVYKVEAREEGKVYVEFSLTNPMCPIGDSLAAQIRGALSAVEGVTGVEVKLVWDPPWSKERLTFEGKLQAGMLGIG
jgi:metal-sulfur cluster biosynthetic enzyme